MATFLNGKAPSQPGQTKPVFAHTEALPDGRVSVVIVRPNGDALAVAFTAADLLKWTENC
jgi:hypothetical protein